jgi:hypothetical protein
MRFTARVGRGPRELRRDLSYVQQVSFNRDHWSEADAEAWLLNRDLKTEGGVAEGGWLRYPQAAERDEKRYSYRDIVSERVGSEPSVRIVVGVPGRPGVQLGRRR